MEKMYFNQLMADYNSIRPFSEEAYRAVFQKLLFRRLPKNFVLKKSNKSDDRSRYICEGYVGMFHYSEENENRLVLLYGPTDTVFDEQSFRKKIPSSFSLKTLSPTILFEFPIEAEQALLVQNPEFAFLALEVAHRINYRNFEQSIIKAKKFETGFPMLLKRFPGIDQILKNRELADYFGVSLSTVERYKRNYYKSQPDEKA
ncbi:Crp/Fnr family transcriptional regulator [Algoriphagus sp. AK58]|uniref:Crp/Fnr family transcriptional regulator n=1 Tax=Algoriphagus sp. AK58 TaxID=1406877 RepID=UPI00164EE5F5|nr:Crp/Fnr family transcriptional regulator [Algoriphagus sp. AK58]MBC6365754.1 hypothetical protein [Algoriphagus sp. AK58]